MRYVGMKISTRQITFIVILALCVSIGYAEILFQDDFEGKNAIVQRVIDETKWMPIPSWKLSDNEDKHAVLGKKVLDIWGHGAGLSVAEFPEEFDYYADFKTMEGTGPGSVARFVFHAQEDRVDPLNVIQANSIYNYYSATIATEGAKYSPQHIGWGRRFARERVWRVWRVPFADRQNRKRDVWYRVKFEVRANQQFHAYLGEVGAAPNELVFVGTWTDNEKKFASGKIGFSLIGSIEWGWGERAQFDNIVVTTPGFLPVEPKGKLPLTWGELKHE
ncbi:hypothetical protein C6499_02100 [Candidatus Poribacteria bacterium]|nr:MAG: hypothetical protein C6499_02100 [Candidatus Poribacteria bacterium]